MLSLLVSNNMCLLSFTCNGIIELYIIWCNGVIFWTMNGEYFWLQLLSYILIPVFYSDLVLFDKEHASWVRLQPPCWPVYSIHGSVERLQRQLGWHSRAFPLSPGCYTEMHVWVYLGVGVDTAGHRSPPLIIRLRCLLPLRVPGYWLGSFVEKPNLRDSLGIASGYRK